MNNETILEIHAVLCDMTNDRVSRPDALYKIVKIVKKANQSE